MGPRQDAGEDHVIGAQNGPVSSRFNGAPAGCRGRLLGATTNLLQRSRLQWGPGRMPGKTTLPPELRDKDADGFNGAPAGCRGRQLKKGSAFQEEETLQWGPGRMPGKTNMRYIARRTDQMSFNGAPAGCRGRRPLECDDTLRWIEASMGPRQDAGEDNRLPQQSHGVLQASMGPRQDAGEDTIRF